MTWRLRAQAHISPGGLRVRLSSLPAGAWSTRHTLHHAMCATAEQQWSKQVCHSPPPPDTQWHIHTGTAASPARERHRGVWGAVNSPAGLVTGHPGTAAQSGPAGKAARTMGRRPGEALTQPNPTQPPPLLPPFSPPPPAHGRLEADRRAAPHPPKRAAAPRGGTPQPRRAQPHAKRPQWAAHSLLQCPLPTRGSAPAPLAATKRRHLGMRRRSGPPWCPPGEGGGTDRGKETSPPHPRQIDPPAADQIEPGAQGCPATRAERIYREGGRRGRRGTGTGATGHLSRAGGWGTAARPPSPLFPTPPPRPPGHGGAGPPTCPRLRGRAPSPRRNRGARGGTQLSSHAARLDAPPPPAQAGVATGGRTRTGSQERRTDHTRGRHATTNRSSMGAAPPMT